MKRLLLLLVLVASSACLAETFTDGHSQSASANYSAYSGIASNANDSVLLGGRTEAQISNSVSVATSNGVLAKASTLYAPVGSAGDTVYGYISGLAPVYVHGTNVYISTGDGYASNKYFECGVTQYVSVATWSPVAWGYQYFYVNYAASTFPSMPAFYASTNQPMFATNINQWVCTNTTGDRLVGAAIQSNQVMVAGCGPTDIIVPASMDAGCRRQISGIYVDQGGSVYLCAALGLYIDQTGTPHYWMINEHGVDAVASQRGTAGLTPVQGPWKALTDGEITGTLTGIPAYDVAAANQTMLPFVAAGKNDPLFYWTRQVQGSDASITANGILVVSSGNPNAAWQDAACSDKLPLSASHALAGWINQGSGATYCIDTDWAVSLNNVVLGASWATGLGACNINSAGGLGSGGALIALGPSRSISWFGPDAASSTFDVWLQGFKLAR